MTLVEAAQEVANKISIPEELLKLTRDEKLAIQEVQALIEKYKGNVLPDIATLRSDAVKLTGYYSYLTTAAGKYLSLATRAQARKRIERAEFILRSKVRRASEEGFAGTEKDFDAAGVIATAPLMKLEAATEAMGKYLSRVADGAFELGRVLDSTLRQASQERFMAQ